MELRRAVPVDGDAVAAIFVAARSGMTYLPPLDVEGASASIRDLVGGDCETWVVLEEQVVTGFATLDTRGARPSLRRTDRAGARSRDGPPRPREGAPP